jgi:hypothetical protein
MPTRDAVRGRRENFLEKWGENAQLRHATSAEVEQALFRAGIEPAERAACNNTDTNLKSAVCRRCGPSTVRNVAEIA